ELTTSGYAFAAEYLDQPTASGPKMTKVDNPFQCPSALDYNDPFDKTQSTNYSLSGFGLATSGSEGLHPKLSMIGGTVQKLADQTSSRKPSGQVAMIVDWIRERGSTSSNSQYNHEGGANVLYGSGEAKWVKYEALIRVSSVSGMLVPPSTYGFAKGGSGGTSIFAPDGKLIESGSGAQNARKAGVGVMW
ncbi:MAG: hypothetical protein HN350_18565, partial [Phycisphaerales bacterium]|nr:hypothetical protein [Phycisphaerales bacterium]